MSIKRTLIAVWAACFIGAFSLQASAQGGWRQWDIYLVDGSKLLGTPLAINEKGRFTNAMGDKEGIERSKISYLAIRERDLRPAPEGPIKQDLVVLRDGTSAPSGGRNFSRFQILGGYSNSSAAKRQAPRRSHTSSFAPKTKKGKTKP